MSALKKFLVNLGIGEFLSLISILSYLVYRILPLPLAVAAIAIIWGGYFWSLTFKFSYWPNRGVNGPDQNLIFGNTLQMRDGIIGFDKKAAAQFGPTYGTFFLGKPQLVTSDLNLLRQIVVKEFSHFPNRRNIAGLHDVDHSPFSHALSVLKDQRWKDVRSTVTPAFTSGKMKMMLPIMNGCSDILMGKVAKYAAENTPVDVKNLFGCLTMDVISKSAFGIDVNAQTEENPHFVRCAKKIFDFSFTDPIIIFCTMFPNFARILQNFTKTLFLRNMETRYFMSAVQNCIAERERNPRTTNPDFLQILLNTMKTDDNNNEKDADAEITHEAISKTGKKVNLKEIEIMAQSFLFLLAGYETTASTLQFIAYELAHHPDVQERCHEQIMDVLGDQDNITYEDLVKLPYLEQVMMETLRMYPPAARFDRVCNEPIQLNGIQFQEDDGVAVAVSVIHNDPQYYPEPEKFDPDRWTSEERSRRDPLTFLAFGYGPRNCIGMRFSQLEIRLTLAALLKKYKFVVHEKTPKKPLKLNTAGLTRALEPIIVSIVKRDG